MGDRRRMEMVRIPAGEQVFERQAVLGRDASSVFPTEAAKVEQENRAKVFKALFGDDKRFITESEVGDGELREIQDVTQRRSGADATGPQKPLAEILREAKEKKDQAFQEGWKQMKTGKNRPLDEEELEFFDKIAEAEALKRRQENAEEAAELDAFRKAREQELRQDAEQSNKSGEQEEDDKKGSLQDVPGASHPRPADIPRPLPKRRKALAAVVRAVPVPANPSPDKSSGPKPIAEDDAPTLGGLLGGYSSDSDSA